MSSSLSQSIHLVKHLTDRGQNDGNTFDFNWLNQTSSQILVGLFLDLGGEKSIFIVTGFTEKFVSSHMHMHLKDEQQIV